MDRMQIVSDDELAQAFDGTDFGIEQPRETVLRVLSDIARGYDAGNTAVRVLSDLDLCVWSGEYVTAKGLGYLMATDHDAKDLVNVFAYLAPIVDRESLSNGVDVDDFIVSLGELTGYGRERTRVFLHLMGASRG